MASKDPNWTPMFRKRRDNSGRKEKQDGQEREVAQVSGDGSEGWRCRRQGWVGLMSANSSTLDD